MCAYLEVDDDEDDKNGGEQVGDIWSVCPIESLLNGEHLVWFGQEEVEESDDGTLELSSILGPDGDWRERFPKDDLTDVSGNEERNTRSQSITFL